MLPKRDQFLCVFINSPFRACNPQVGAPACPAKRGWHPWLMAPDGSRHFCPHKPGVKGTQPGSSLLLLGSKQGAEPSPDTQDVSARIARHDLAENLHPHRHEVFFPCHHGFSGASRPGLPSQLPTQRVPPGLPLSSRQPPPGLTTNEKPLWQHVWVSEMTPLSLLLSHCYWDWDARKTKHPLTEGVSSQGPRPTWPHSGLHLSQCSWMEAKCSMSSLEYKGQREPRLSLNTGIPGCRPPPTETCAKVLVTFSIYASLMQAFYFLHRMQSSDTH